MTIYRHDLLVAETLNLYDTGLDPGFRTGWPSVDRFYTVAPAQWTLITGTPNSGKSEWLDALMVNLAKTGKWKFLIYSPENWPLKLHASKIAEKYLGKPFDNGPTPRMDKEELDEALEWMRGKFLFARPDHPNVPGILCEAIDTTGIVSLAGSWMTGIVIDPWNSLEHYRPREQSETDFISETLSTVIDFVRGNWAERNHAGSVHVFIVAHPRLMQKDRDGKYPIPRPYDVSGSAHWWNKADNCITIWRDQGEGTQEVQIHVQKVRFKHIGRIGVAELKYDRVTGRYHEPLTAVRSGKDYAAGD